MLVFCTFVQCKKKCHETSKEFAIFHKCGARNAACCVTFSKTVHGNKYRQISWAPFLAVLNKVNVERRRSAALFLVGKWGAASAGFPTLITKSTCPTLGPSQLWHFPYSFFRRMLILGAWLEDWRIYRLGAKRGKITFRRENVYHN